MSSAGREFGAIVHELATRKLAQIIYERVSANSDDRHLLDWHTAEHLIHCMPERLCALQRFFTAMLDCNELLRYETIVLPSVADRLGITYEVFDRLCGFWVVDDLWSPGRELLTFSSRPDAYGHIRRY